MKLEQITLNVEELNSYILDRVTHETDIIMESEWFDEKVKEAIKRIKEEEINSK